MVLNTISLPVTKAQKSPISGYSLYTPRFQHLHRRTRRVFGEIALLNGKERSADANAQGECWLLVYCVEKLPELVLSVMIGELLMMGQQQDVQSCSTPGDTASNGAEVTQGGRLWRKADSTSARSW